MEQSLIVFTEARARDLRLTYSRFLAPRRLLARVLEVEHRAQATLDQKGGMVDCFGRDFAGYVDAACSVCQLQAACLVRTTADVLPGVEARVGANVKALAAALRAPLQAIGLMHALRETLLDPDDPQYVEPPLLKHGQGRRPVADVSAWRNIPPKRRSSLLAYAALLGAQASETAWPPPPRPVTQRLGHALQSTYVLHVLAWVPQRLVYGSPTWKRRLARDRRRYPELGYLPEGTVLQVVRHKELIRVTVYADRYLWRGQTFATLYEICAAAGGTVEYKQSPKQLQKYKGTRRMPKQSARRFFKPCLDEIERRVQHVRAQQPGQTPPKDV